MTTTQRKSAPTADTVEGTNAILHTQDTTQQDAFQDPDTKGRILVHGADGHERTVYGRIKNHLAKLYKMYSGKEPNKQAMDFIKTIADTSDEAYARGYFSCPCNDKGILRDEASTFLWYTIACEYVESAYKQGCAQKPYDVHGGAI